MTMKRVIFVIMMFLAVVGVYAAAVPGEQLEASDGLRSEQFYLDSLRLVTQERMYADSLNAEFEKQHLMYNQPSSFMEDSKIVIPLGFFLMVLGIVVVSVVTSYKNKSNFYKVMEKAIEVGQPVPEGLFLSGKRNTEMSPSRTLRVSFILLGIGIGGLILGMVIPEVIVCAVSSAPILIGLGYLVVYYMERKQERADRAKEVHSDNSDKIVSGEDEK